ncbi:hypothetical protein MNBD_GAMMA12-2958 [hydrothermal vent metagenome]|uniref:Death on curing protein, Doc toxin n=1 Tax=hydrothermal vent metagenome TaxID=652676 RepID=A0A3B0Y8R2_9ZZZZ
MTLKFTQSAQKDLIRLHEFIAIKNPQAARRISQRLKQSIQQLMDQPEIGVNVTEVTGVRDLISGDYIVRYTVLDSDIYILRIWHGKEYR